MSNKRWEFTGETKINFGVTLKRIRASEEFILKCSIVIRKGKLGGWIEKESNLSGDAWVSDNAMVYGNARVYDHARVCGYAMVSGDARVCGNAWVCDAARQCAHAMV